MAGQALQDAGGDSARSPLRLVVWLAALAVAVTGLTAAGSGPLAGPPLTAPDAWSAWAAAREPVVAVVAGLRLIALALAWYLVATTVFGTVTRLSGRARLVRVADAATLPVVRRILHAAIGVGLVGTLASAPSAAVTAAPTAAAAADPGPPAMEPLPDIPPHPSAPGTAPTPAAPPAMAPIPDPARPGSAADAAPTVTAGASYTVVRGDHLWSIAAATLEAELGTTPTDDVIAPYWRDLVAANRQRLVDPANPDLIYPGDVIVLPPVVAHEH